jgi:large subunit ribosomal protein L17
MRHSKRKHKLGVSGPHRSAMMGNLAVALITHGRIETTLPKARALLTLAKKAEKANDAARKLHYRRLAIARVRDKAAVAKLFDERVTEFTERNGGYTRIYKLGQRIGDAAEMGLIELIDGNDEGYSKKPTKKAAKKKAAKKVAKNADDEEAPAEEAAEVEEAKEEAPAPEAAEVEEVKEEAPAAEAEVSAEEAEEKKDA